MTSVYWMMLGLGAAAMYGVMVAQRKYYKISSLKCLWLTVTLTLSGVLGAKLMYFLESGGSFSGESFYGALFLAPVLMTLVAKLSRVPVWKVLDLCAPAECIMLAIHKVRCAIAGCCRGRVLFKVEYTAVRFPSQIVETVTALILMLILIKMMRKGTHVGEIYPIYMLMYGVLRFVLNSFRVTAPIAGWLAYGHIWSVVSAAIGLAWLLCPLWKKRKVKRYVGENVH